jgi:glycosyltransferase involved in cell wall biosynthesis
MTSDSLPDDRATTRPAPPRLSVVAPLFNEAPTVAELHARLTATLRATGQPYEIVLVDDGSTDGTGEALERLGREDAAVRVVRLARNYGQTAALEAGFDHARGEVVVAIDGDLQNQPEDIPRLLAVLDQGYDVVSGWRVNRHGSYWTRRVPSRVANWMIAKVSGVGLHDTGATLKAYRRRVVRQVRLHGEMHRFVPALASWYGARVTEIPISDKPRPASRSHYGLSRTWRVMADLLTVRFLLRYATRPLHLFGPAAFGLAGLGVAAGVVAIGDAVAAAPAGHGWLAAISVTLIAAGVNLLAMGLLAEMLTRVYFDGRRRRIYTLRPGSEPGRFDRAPAGSAERP